MITSGIRLGTPALTTRGMKSNEMIFIAKLIVDVLKNPGNDQLIDKTRKKVRDLCKVFPLYADIGLEK
jgi:glycine hydroxymethyltransferase